MGKLVNLAWRYAHLAPNHLTEQARKIDALLSDSDTNTTQGENQAPTGFEQRSYNSCYY